VIVDKLVCVVGLLSNTGSCKYWVFGCMRVLACGSVKEKDVEGKIALTERVRRSA
jgi:hypothetical protein